MFKRFGLVLIILFLGHIGATVHAQDEKLLSTRYLSQKHPDSALIILKKLHARAIDNNDKLSEGQCLQQMGQICYNQGHYAQALEFYLHADKLFSARQKSGYASRQHGRNGCFVLLQQTAG
jgi:tetratricopeptide (TPR) repeat protein